MRLVIGSWWLTRAAVVLGVVGTAVAHRIAATAGAPRPVVIAELFTSEGCSSCPPADDVLRRLAEGELVDDVDVVALGEHVDYWDRLDWRDPFSSPLFAKRQSEYDATVFRTNRIYTPQLVVDGTLESVGSDVGAVRRALAKAARAPKATVAIAAGGVADGRIHVDVRVEMSTALAVRGPADVVIAVTEDGLVSHVQRGENGGRTLHHAAVVRSITTVGALTATDQPFSTSAEISVSAEWPPSHLRIVSFIQERASRRILGGAATPLGLPKASPAMVRQAAALEAACGRAAAAADKWRRLERPLTWGGSPLAVAIADDARTRLGKGRTAAQRRRLEEALDSATRTLESGGTSSPGTLEYARALLLAGLGRPGESRTTLEHVFVLPDRNLSHALARLPLRGKH